VIELGSNRYGKSAIRLVKVDREPDRQRVRDLTVDVSLEGDFEAAHTSGDNANVVATDTMKNTVYAFASEHLTGAIESFGRVLAEHFAANPQVARATIAIREQRWSPIPTEVGPSPDAFVRTTDFVRTARISVSHEGQVVTDAGIDDLIVMKTAGSAFKGFPRDRYTTLAETDDRIMATRVNATWRYASHDLDWEAVFDGVRATLLDTMADHLSPSVQASIWIVGRAILERHSAVEEIRMILPNLHHWTVDLSPFGLANRNEIFIPTTEPHGLIEATVRRSADR
jgi:urate oxidase